MEQWKRGTKERSRRYVSEAYVQTLAAAAGISMITAFLFYRSVWGMCTFFVFAPLCLKFRQKREAARREVQIQKEFLTAMESVSGALMAGYSLESAWKYAQQETEQMYGIQGIFSRELRQLNQKLFMHEPMEQLLYELAERCDNEEIYHFAEILLYVKRSGGNMTEIIHRTVCRMQEKHEVLREITANVAAKRAEQKMMMLLLPLMLCFLTVSSPEYTGALYGNPAGVLVMSGCLAGYLGALFWAEKIVDIPV